MSNITALEKEINKLKERNMHVEIDKAWELSNTRKIIIALLTYGIIVLFFFSANLPNPFVNSIVPALAFVVSTLSLPFFKKIWIKNLKTTKKYNI